MTDEAISPLRRRMIEEGEADESVKRVERTKLNALLGVCADLIVYFHAQSPDELRRLHALLLKTAAPLQ